MVGGWVSYTSKQSLDRDLQVNCRKNRPGGVHQATFKGKLMMRVSDIDGAPGRSRWEAPVHGNYANADGARGRVAGKQ